MADKSVGELIAAQSVTPTDLFVLEQNGTAKKLTGQTLENWLLSFADGHGGIHSWEPLETVGLVTTYRITLADQTHIDIDVVDGRGISHITKTSTSGLVDTHTITYNDGSTSTFTVTNGAKGDKGDNSYLWIKYASQEPTDASHSIGNLPDDWIGIYSGTLEEAPEDWTMYSWFKIKGETGETGAPAVLVSTVTEYQVSDSGTIIPSGVWTATIPNVPQGKYLWSRTTNTFNSGSPAVSYSVSRMGLDGSGSVSSVANISPDANGNVPLTAEDLGALPIGGGEMDGPIDMAGQPLTGLNHPTLESDAVNKGYSDKEITNRVIRSGGKNLYDINQVVPSNPSVTAVDISGESIRVYSTAASGAFHATKGNLIQAKANTPYTMSVTVESVTSGSVAIGFRSGPGNANSNENSILGGRTTVTGPGEYSKTYTPTEDMVIYASLFVTGNTSGETGDATFSGVMVEAASEKTGYEPYYIGLAELTGIVNTLLGVTE